MNIKNRACLLLLIATLVGCSKEAEVNESPPIRGVKTLLISELQNSIIRRYPSVLQPAESSNLSFQIGGQLKELGLRVGQRVKAGQVIARLDDKALVFAVQEAKAALEEAMAAAENAEKDMKRNTELRNRNLIGQAALDNSVTNAKTLTSRVIQARNKYSVAKDNLEKTQLIAPFDGVINSVFADSFDTVTSGTPIANLYNPNQFEARFSVSNVVASSLNIGRIASVTLADYPELALEGRVTELAEGTNIVSSFPVVVGITEGSNVLKSGMAVEIGMEFSVIEGDGYPIPITAVLVDGIRLEQNGFQVNDSLSAQVFVYDEATSTVILRNVKVVGVRSNDVIISSGLLAGERVVTAGVPFLREGQRVKLLASE